MSHGNEKLIKLVGLIAHTGNAIGESLEDGKLSIFDLTNFFGLLGELSVLSEIDDIIIELGKLDESKIKEIVEHAKKEFDISNDALENKIESGLEMLERIYDVYQLVKDYIKPDASSRSAGSN